MPLAISGRRFSTGIDVGPADNGVPADDPTHVAKSHVRVVLPTARHDPNVCGNGERLDAVSRPEWQRHLYGCGGSAGHLEPD